MVTILGAGGAIGGELVKELTARNEPVRLVSRNPKLVPGVVETVAADLSNFDNTLKAVSGSRVAFLIVGLKYDVRVWRELWPRIMRNAIEAAKRANARLVFFDNVYMYGKVDGAMTEETPFHPCSKKGEIRAEIATTLLNEMKAGNLSALIARSADFYGPRAPTGLPNVLVFDKFAKGETLVHVHAGRRAEPGSAGGQRKRLESKPGTFLQPPIRQSEKSSLNSLRTSSGRNRSTECSPGRCSGWRDGSIRPSGNYTRCSTNTNSTTSSIRPNSRRRSVFDRPLTPTGSAEPLKPTGSRVDAPRVSF